MLRDHGQAKKYYHAMIGWNARMDGIQGAVLSVKLKHLPAWNEARRRNAALYDELLKGVKGVAIPGRRPTPSTSTTSTRSALPTGTRLIAALAEKDIHCGIHYPIPLHLQEAYKSLGSARGASRWRRRPPRSSSPCRCSRN